MRGLDESFPIVGAVPDAGSASRIRVAGHREHAVRAANHGDVQVIEVRRSVSLHLGAEKDGACVKESCFHSHADHRTATVQFLNPSRQGPRGSRRAALSYSIASMGVFTIILTILGLSVFETISSVDNAIINAQVLSDMQPRARRWFLLWGMLFAVFVVRGLLPWLIVWMALPTLGPIGAFVAAFSSDPSVVRAVESASPVLFMGGGIFLVLLFLHWLFLEPKQFGLAGEKFFASQGVWFYAAAAVFLAVSVWFALRVGPLVGFAAVIGSTVFFITHGFKENAEAQEKRLMTAGISDLSKILYLEIIDMTFSIDGVLGAFAFTLSVPLIIAGNGLGAVIVRQITVGNIDRIKKLRYLKNGAMYSILVLGLVMMCDAFGIRIPLWVSPTTTFVIVGFFFARSVRELRRTKKRRAR